MHEMAAAPARDIEKRLGSSLYASAPFGKTWVTSGVAPAPGAVHQVVNICPELVRRFRMTQGSHLRSEIDWTLDECGRRAESRRLCAHDRQRG